MALAEIDIWRAANVIVRQHGADATVRRSARGLEGDREGQAVWLRIGLAIIPPARSTLAGR